MKIRYVIILAFLSVISSSTVFAACNRTSNMFFGGALGTAAGAGIGYAIDRGPGGAILGGVIGGLLGGAIGNDSCGPQRVQQVHTRPIYYPQPVSVPVCSTVVYRDVYHEPDYVYQQRMAKIAREQLALEQARYRALRAENERLRWERDRALLSNDGCYEYYYTTTVCH